MAFTIWSWIRQLKYIVYLLPVAITAFFSLFAPLYWILCFLAFMVMACSIPDEYKYGRITKQSLILPSLTVLWLICSVTGQIIFEAPLTIGLDFHKVIIASIVASSIVGFAAMYNFYVCAEELYAREKSSRERRSGTRGVRE